MSPNVGHYTIALFEALGKANVKATIICETNPVHTLPNLNKAHKAMSNSDTSITVIEAFSDAATLEYADLIPPPAFWRERDGTYGCGEQRYPPIEKAAELPADCRPTVNTLIEFAKRAGVDPKLVSSRNSADVRDERRRLPMRGPYNFGGTARECMKCESGLIWPCPTEMHPGTNLCYVRGEDSNIPVDHPDKIWFYGNPSGKANIWMRPYKSAAEEPDQEYPFYLTSIRVIDHWRTVTMTGKVPELPKANPAVFVEVNTEGAS